MTDKRGRMTCSTCKKYRIIIVPTSLCHECWLAYQAAEIDRRSEERQLHIGTTSRWEQIRSSRVYCDWDHAPCWSSQEEADSYLDFLDIPRTGPENESYFCDICEHWHVTKPGVGMIRGQNDRLYGQKRTG